MRDHWWSRNSSSFYGREAYGGDSIRVSVGMPVELLAKDIWIDFPITEVAGIELQKGLHGFKKGVGAPDDGGAAVEDEPSAGLKPIEALLDNPHGERNAKFPSAMPIKAPVIIYEVWRVCHDDISVTFDAREYVAEHDFCRWHIIKDRIDLTQSEGFLVDIAEHNFYLAALPDEPSVCSNATRATAAPDIDEP